MIAILIILSKSVTLGLLRIKILWNKGYDIMILIYRGIKKIVWPESNNIMNVVMWPKFGKSSISIREVIIALIL